MLLSCEGAGDSVTADNKRFGWVFNHVKARWFNPPDKTEQRETI